MPVPEYISMVSGDTAARLRRWHDAANARAPRGEETVDYLGCRLVIPADVMPITPVSHLLGEAVLAQTRATDRVLDMGTGSGVNAILAARGGADVVAVDINPSAVECAGANATRNGVAIDVRHSDVFSDVSGAFDLMVWDPPFRWFAARDARDRATTDENYGALRTFFASAASRLRPGGRILLFFGTSGDVEFLRHLIAVTGFEYRTIAQSSIRRDDTVVEYYTFRVTRPVVQARQAYSAPVSES